MKYMQSSFIHKTVCNRAENRVLKQYLELKVPDKNLSPEKGKLTEHPPGQLCKFSTKAVLYKWFKNNKKKKITQQVLEYSRQGLDTTNVLQLPNSMAFCDKQLSWPKPCALVLGFVHGTISGS